MIHPGHQRNLTILPEEVSEGSCPLQSESVPHTIFVFSLCELGGALSGMSLSMRAGCLRAGGGANVPNVDADFIMCS